MAGTCFPCQPQSSGLPSCNLGSGLPRRTLGSSQCSGRVSWRHQSAKRNSTFSAQHSLGSHRAQQRRSCRCEASDSNGKPGLLSGLKKSIRDIWFSKHGERELSNPETEAQEAPQPGTDIVAHSNDTSWQEWAEHMDSMDRRAQQALKVEKELALETALERFDKAAQLKKRLDELGSVDLVGDLVKEYEQAVKEEDYAKAAALRDEGAMGLTGWWVRDDTDDPHGHLLHIAPAFARYVGYAYTAQELAHAAGVPSSDEEDAITQPQDPSDAAEDFGTPILELFLRRNAQGQLQQQGTALKLPEDASGNILPLVFTEGKDGKQSIIPVKHLLEQATRQHAQATGGAKSSSSGKASDSPEAELSKLKHKTMNELVERLPATIAQTSRDRLEVTLHPESFNSGLRRQVLTEADASDDEEEEETDEETDEEDSDSEEEEDSDADDAHVLGEEVEAKLRQWRDRLPSGTHSAEHHLTALLELAADSDEDPTSSDEDPTSIKVIRTEHSDGRVEYSLGDDSAETSSDEEEDDDDVTIDVTDSDDKKPSWETVVNNVLEVVKQLKEFAPEPGKSKEQKARHAELMKKLDEAEKSLTVRSSPQSRRAKLKARLAAQKRKSAEAKATLKALEDSSQLLNALWQQAGETKGFELSEGSDDEEAEEDSDDEELLKEHIVAAFEKALALQHSNPRNIIKTPDPSDTNPSTIKYRRLNTDFVSTDPFTGLYLAAFGAQGVEVLQLKREPDDIDDGIEWVTGTKLTGSNVVPAGEVSFKAKIGRRGRLGTPDMYPPEMGVIARYRGSGCIAQSGLQQPTWVDGELLHLNGDFTRGAELGFIWSSQQQQSHYLVVLKKIDLSDT